MTRRRFWGERTEIGGEWRRVLRGDRTHSPRRSRSRFHARYCGLEHSQQGRYPALMAVASSAKKTRYFAYGPPRARARCAPGQSSRPYILLLACPPNVPFTGLSYGSPSGPISRYVREVTNRAFRVFNRTVRPPFSDRSPLQVSGAAHYYCATRYGRSDRSTLPGAPRE